MNNLDELYGALKSIGLSEEYIEFINCNINDDGIVNNIISEVLSGKIFDAGSFVEYFNKHFKIIPNINMFMKNSMNSNVNIPLTAAGIASGISVYSRIADTITDRILSENMTYEKDGDNVVISNESYVKADILNTPEVESMDIPEFPDNENEVSENIQEFQVSEKKPPLSDNEVTQHTAGLWKYQPVNNDEPENSDEYMTKKVILSDAQIIGASVRGKKHKHDGSNRDDCFDIAVSDDIAVIAVSDGAGSKKFSRIGAEYACKSSAESAVKLIEELKISGDYEKCIEDISSPLDSEEFMRGCGRFADIVQQSVISAYNAVHTAFDERKTKYDYLKALKRDMELRDFSATLLLTVIVPVKAEGINQLFVISCQIGDGMISAVSRNLPYTEAVKLLGEADSGAFAGETDFITSESMQQKEKLMGRTKVARREISDIMIMTDGVADDYYPNSVQLGRLYLDLQANGIISAGSSTDSISDDELINRIPEPVSYPWVNDNSIEVPVNYSSVIAENCGITSELLWESPDIIRTALSKLGENNAKPEEKLKIWLDNYVERGSFDDRTLVIYSVNNNQEKAEVFNNEQTG